MHKLYVEKSLVKSGRYRPALLLVALSPTVRTQTRFFLDINTTRVDTCTYNSAEVKPAYLRLKVKQKGKLNQTQNQL